MANDKKFIVKKGLVAPNVDFANGSGTISATYLNSSNTLSFSGNTGQLFSITDSMSGTIFSVNDISGIPSIEVMDTGAVKIAETFGTVAIGANTTSGYKLYVNGNTLFGNSVTLNSTVIANGSVGTSGFVLTSNGTGVYWAAANASITTVLNANNSTYLQGRTWATPFAIGSTVANSASFTTLDTTGNIELKNNATYIYGRLSNGLTQTRLLGINSSNAVYIGSIDNAASATIINVAANSGPVTIYSNAAPVATFTKSGNAGIGTENPSTRLHVNGQIRIEHSSDKALDFTRAGASTYSIEHDTSRIYFYNASNANTLIAMTNQNLVGIGTGNPAYKLHVIGDVGITNGLVANGSFGTAGHVLTSNGTAIYWAAANSSISSVLNANNASYLGTFAAADYPRKAEAAAITGAWNFSNANIIWSSHSYTNTYDGSNVYQHIGTATSTDKIWNIRVYKADNSFSTFTFNYGGVATAPQSFRSSYFYDIDDTAYYANPAGTSLFFDLLINNKRPIIENDIIQPFNPFGSSGTLPKKLLGSHFTNRFGGRGSELYVTKDNVEVSDANKAVLFDGSFDNTWNIAAANTAAFVLNINTVTNNFTNSSGIVYADGILKLAFYPGRGPSVTPTARWKDKDGVWRNLTVTQDYTYGAEYIGYQISGLSGNYLTDIEITITPKTTFDCWITELEYHGYRMGLNEGPIVGTFGGTFYNNINSKFEGIETFRLNTSSGSAFFVGNVGVANTNPGQTLQVDGSVGIKNGLVANGSFGTAGQVLTSNGSVVYWAADYANASNITTGTLAEARLPYRMNQNVRTTDSVTFANMTVTGNVVVSGTVTTWNANNITISDNMIYLNANGFNTNPDVGIAASYNDGTYRHTGFFRDATDGVWKVYDQYLPEPDASIYIDTANASFRIADFQANVVNAASVVINNAQAYRQRDGTGTIRTLLTTLSDSSVLFNGYQGTPMMNGVNGATYLYGSGSGSIVMTLLSGGNVGIGNTSPTSRLQLNYATGDAGGIRLQQAGWAYSTRIGAVGTSGDQQYWSTNFNAATNAVDVATQYTTYVLQNPSAGTVTFGTSNGAGYAPEERMRIFHNNIKLTPNVATMSSQNIAFEVAPPTLPSSHQPRNFVKLTDQYNNNSNGHDLTIRSFSSGVNYGGWLIRSNWGGSLRLASTQNAFAEANSFPAAYASITPTSMDMVGLTLNAVGITASANVNLDSGTLFTDATTNRVGIGTTNPVTTLDVRGNISASNGAFNALTTTQSIADTTGSGNGSLRILHPAGGAFSNNQPSVVGAIKIKLPPNTFKSNTMMRMTIKIYDYNGGASGTSRTIEVGGYNYSDAGANWINCFATQSTMGGDDINVRFGNDGGTNCIWIGETSTVWQYPQVYITEFQGGYSSFTQSAWGAGWVISMVSAFDTVTQGPIIAAKPLTSQNYASYVTTTTANNANFLQNRRWETAGAIGATVANTGAFTTLTASANVNFDSGVLFTDATSNRVGINTVTPLHSLHNAGAVYATGDASSVAYYMNDSQAIRSSGNMYIDADTSGQNGFTRAGAGDLIFRTAGAQERMRITGGGNIGIGNSAPNAGLEIQRAGVMARFKSGSATDARVEWGYNQTDIGYIAAETANQFSIYARSGNSLKLGAGNSERMRIDSAGNIGIGTSTPSAPLMFGKAVYGAPSSEDFYRIKFEDFGGIANDVGFGQPVSGSMGVNVLASSGYFSISAGTDGEKMRVRFDGNVGIGSTNPQSTLDLGDGTGGKGITWGGSGGASRYASIFTPYSASGLVLGGGFHGNTSSDSYVTSFTGTYYHNGMRINTFGAEGIQFFTDTNVARTAGAAYTPTERMRIAPGGNISIGTSANARAKLEVAGDIWTDWNNRFIGTVFSDGTSYRLGINTIVNTRDTQIWAESADGTGVSGITFHTGTGPTERMRVSNTGNLGVGTTTPQYRLDVNNAATSANSFQASFGTTMLAGVWSGIHFGYSEANNTSYRKSAIVFERQDSSARGKIHILNNDGNSAASASLSDSKMTIQYDGNVGIGVTSPTQRLSVAGRGQFTVDYPDIRLLTTSNYGWRIAAGSNGTTLDKLYFQATTDGFATASSPMVIDNNSNVGIGTLTPSYKLEVNGSFAATTKSFVINHPTKEGMKLRYGSLEGPENGVYVRGRLKGSNTIELPDYWTGLVHEDSITVNLTPIGKHQKLYVEDVSIDQIIVGNDNLLSKEINCFYTVYAERKDVEKLVVEY